MKQLKCGFCRRVHHPETLCKNVTGCWPSCVGHQHVRDGKHGKCVDQNCPCVFKVLARKDEEITSLKESLREVLEISEVEGAVNLTTMESAKLIGARTLLGPESRFADKRKCPDCGAEVPEVGAVCTACYQL